MINHLCLNITDSCNFNCKYCFVNKKPNHMSFDVADKAIQWLLENTNSKNPSVFFFGGEPTLQWDNIIVPLVNKYSQLQYSITTNGFLLNEEKIDFLAEHNFAVMLSMDGNEITQSYNRNENSFEKLDTIIPYLLEKIQPVNFRGTIIPDTCEYTFENIDYAQSKGFKKCYFTINIFEQWTNEKKQLLEREIKKYVLAYINSFINEKEIINFTPLTNMIQLIIKNEIGILDNNINIYKCGLGNSYAAINYKGDIFTCQEIVTSDNNELFNIGNIYSGLNTDKINYLTNIIVNDMPIVNNETSCQDCPLKFCCKKNMCQVNNYLCNNHCLIQSYNQCWWNQLLYNCAAFIISCLQDLPNFQEYMKNIILEKEVYNG